MGEAASTKLEEERKKMKAFVSEARIEIPEAAVCFSDPCPCCGNRKRRCLRPPSTPRKKRLLFNCNADTDAAGTSPAYSPSSTLTTPTSAVSAGSPTPNTPRVISPVVPLRIIRASVTTPTPTSASPPSLPLPSSDHRLLERSNPGPGKPSVCGSPQAAAGGPSDDEEVRIRIKCKCGVVREVVLVR